MIASFIVPINYNICSLYGADAIGCWCHSLLILLTLIYEGLFICVLMIPDCELMLLGPISVAIFWGWGIFVVCFCWVHRSTWVSVDHLGYMINGPKHCELGLVLRNSQGNHVSFVSVSLRAKARPVSFILWSEFLLLIYPLRLSFWEVLTFYGNFQSDFPPCQSPMSCLLLSAHLLSCQCTKSIQPCFFTLGMPCTLGTCHLHCFSPLWSQAFLNIVSDLADNFCFASLAIHQWIYFLKDFIIFMVLSWANFCCILGNHITTFTL